MRFFVMAYLIPSLAFEHVLWSRRLVLVAGLDEVGRGAWAGPVVAGAVILPRVRRFNKWWTEQVLRNLAGARDSKLLMPAQRDALFEPIRAAALACATGLATHAEIDAIGIVPATRLAMLRAIEALPAMPNALLVDAGVGSGGRPPLPTLGIPQKSLVHGDQLCLSIACASILAKVTRDRIMIEMDRQIPGYVFGQHKGYGTAAHRAALENLGPSAEHRMSFAPIKNLSASEGAPTKSAVLGTPESALGLGFSD
jgi:ribonuclease HII